jgi:hypothetical protein
MSSENFLIGYDAKDETLLRPHYMITRFRTGLFQRQHHNDHQLLIIEELSDDHRQLQFNYCIPWKKHISAGTITTQAGVFPLNRSSNLPQRNAKGGMPGKFLTFTLCRESPQPVDLSLYIEHNRLTHIGFPQEHFNILYSMWHVPTSELFVNSILFSHP